MRLTRSLLALGVLLIAAPAIATPPLAASPAKAATDAAPLLARLDANSRTVRILSGEFTQKNRMKLFKQELSSRGRFFFERPRRIRWEYTSPDPSTLVLDGEKATLRTPGAPLQSFDLTRDAVMRTIFDQLLLWLGSGSLETARADYDLSTDGGASPALILVPKRTSPIARAFARIELRFDDQLLLRAILLREPSGDEKQIDFGKLAPNGKLPKDAFTP